MGSGSATGIPCGSSECRDSWGRRRRKWSSESLSASRVAGDSCETAYRQVSATGSRRPAGRCPNGTCPVGDCPRGIGKLSPWLAFSARQPPDCSACHRQGSPRCCAHRGGSSPDSNLPHPSPDGLPRAVGCAGWKRSLDPDLTTLLDTLRSTGTHTGSLGISKGTTNLVAAGWGRNSLGLEVDDHHFALARSRMESAAADLFKATSIRIVDRSQEASRNTWSDVSGRRSRSSGARGVHAGVVATPAAPGWDVPRDTPPTRA